MGRRENGSVFTGFCSTTPLSTEASRSAVTYSSVISEPRLLFFFFFKEFFECGPFLKSLLNLLQYYLYFMFWFLAVRHVGFYLPDQGSNPHPLHWKAKS